MTVQKMIQEAQKLSVEEREQLAQALQLMSQVTPQKITKKHRLSDLRGLGAEIWKDVDAQEYVNELREEWDNR
jgi:hypothetical protein